MARDVAGYLSEVKLLTGRQNAAIDTLIYEWLNDLFEMLETDPEKLWFFDKTVRFSIGVSDAGTYGVIIQVPSDFVDEYTLFRYDTADNAYTEVTAISELEAKKKYGPNDVGPPTHYSLEGKSLRFWPGTPDATYTIEMSYKAALTRVSATTDTNDFMENYHAVIIDGLQAKLWEYLGLLEKAQFYWQKWERKWADLRASNVSRVLAGEVRFEPRTDANARSGDQRSGTDIPWGL